MKEAKRIPFVLGNGLETMMLICYEKGDIDSLLKILPSMPCKYVLAVCKGEAHIEGDDIQGFRIKYEKEGSDE